MSKYNFFINPGVWGYEPIWGTMTAVWGHKYHILPVNSSPLTISIAIFLLIMTIISDLHLSLDSSFITFYIYYILRFFFFIYVHCPFSISTSLTKFEIYSILFSSSTIPVNIESASSYLYIHWIAPFFLVLGLFFLWNSNAIEEGTTSTISASKKNLTNLINLESRIVILPTFHTNLVRKGFKIGFILFIISEIMLFFGFFWAFFHSSLSPAVQIGAVWPPLGVDFITIKGFAVANTIILLTSGATLTIAHYALELVPLKRISLFKKRVPWEEPESLYVNPTRDPKWMWRRTRMLKWAPDFSYYQIKSFKSFLEQNQGLQYYKEYCYRYTPFLMLTGIQKYFYFQRQRSKTELAARIYIATMINCTLLLALIFMIFQLIEYFISPVNINTGIYGSTFFMITGLHGFHVFVGSCFLFYCRTAIDMNRILTIMINIYEIAFHPVEQKKSLDEVITKDSRISFLGNFKTYNSWLYGKDGIESFECAAWYWHFVDVVWIFVFGFVYVWSHLTILEQD